MVKIKILQFINGILGNLITIFIKKVLNSVDTFESIQLLQLNKFTIWFFNPSFLVCDNFG